MDQAVICSTPDAIHIQRRRCHRVDHTALFCFRSRIAAILSDTRGQVVRLASKVRADLFPILTAVARLPKRITGKEKQVRIGRGKDNRLGAQHSKIRRLQRHRQNTLCLPGATVVARQFAAIDDVGIKRISHDVAILLGSNRVPIAKSDCAVIAAASDSDGAALLLAAIQSIGKRVVRTDVIKLRSRLVIPGAPALPAIDGHDRALIAAEQNDVWVFGIDPDVLVIVTARCAAPAVPCFAAIDRFPANDACGVNCSRIFRIEPNDRQLAAADSRSGTRIIRRVNP